MGIKMEDFLKMTQRLAGGKKPVTIVPRPAASKPATSFKIIHGVNLAIVLPAMEQHGLPLPTIEHRFHPGRKWKFDMAWIEWKVALEIQGGLFAGKPCAVCGRRSGGRHNHASALLKEYEKMNAATVLGWRVLYFLPDEMTRLATFEAIRSALKWRVSSG